MNEPFRLGFIKGDEYARSGQPRICCYVEEREHPTYPTCSDHAFGYHPYLAPMVGCDLCNKNLNVKVREAGVAMRNGTITIPDGMRRGL